MCNYQGYEFSGGYPDSVCNDGYLWDADSGGIDEAGNIYLDHGGDLPCPSCNRAAWLAYHREDIIGIGQKQGAEGQRARVVMYGGYPAVVRTDSWAMKKAKRWIMRGWYRGKKERANEI
ncbi:Uncharacterised protein [Serratia ficaria]|uniref:hypothetical protein n=1 Tax=Serratia ficaria TaxID=61651 RepID=UPI002182F6BB|nr:hypothetical protein [Serratia ficaria]CAI2528585.1 Uncharacterised protein [Serratia ficaria]CAI2794179.1 Uncharacterised protein [Serratia ficaria]